MAEVKIVGTAHVSQQSVDEVRAAIGDFKPDVVAIELDSARFTALKKQARDPSVSDVLEVKNFNSLLVQWLLAYLQRKIGIDVGVEPGAEMKIAIEEAEQRGIPIALVDRDIRLTLLRFWSSLGFIEKIKMFWALISSIAEIDNGQEIDIESLKEQNVIDAVMEEFRKFSPNGARALIDERDAFIAHQLVLFRDRKRTNLAMVESVDHRQMPDPDIQDVSAYLAGLKIASKLPPADETAPDFNAYERLLASKRLVQIPRAEGDPEAGQKLYRRECAACHGDQGQGDLRDAVPFLAGQYTNYLWRQIDKYIDKGRLHDPSEPDAEELLAAFKREELQDILAYLSTLDD